jgi:purine-nucleoside phosphorylase
MSAFDVAGAAACVRERIQASPRIGIVLGSGLGALEGEISGGATVPFEDVPGFPRPTVEGHAGRYVAGMLSGVEVLLQCGRFHLYEGHRAELVATPVRLAAELGVQALVLTNAAGGIRASLELGDLVVLRDHLNFQGASPLVGPVREGDARFPDMSTAYDPQLRRLALDVAQESGERLEEGVYAAMLGPQYETPAEVRMLGLLGADVVGMSTVPEVIAARAAGIRCLAFSVVSNKAAGLAPGPIHHEEVIEGGHGANARLITLLRRLIPRIAECL